MQLDPADDRAMIAAAASRRVRRPWMQLLAAVEALAQSQGEVLHHAEQPWASVTFSGTRHNIALRFTGDAAVAAGEAFIAALPDHEFTIPRQLVADASIVSAEHRLLPEAALLVEVELLLLEDC